MNIPSEGLIRYFTRLVDRIFERHLMNPGQLTQLLNSDEWSGYILFPTRQELKERSESARQRDAGETGPAGGDPGRDRGPD